MQPARDAGAAPQAPGGSDPQPHMPPPAHRAGARRVRQRRPMQTLCDAHKALACKSCRGHRGVRHCCSRHHEGHPRMVPVAGGARPPPPGGGGQRRRQWVGGFLRLGRHAGAHRAFGEPAPRPWEGRGGRHLTKGARSFCRAAAPGLGGGRGAGAAQPAPNP